MSQAHPLIWGWVWMDIHGYPEEGNAMGNEIVRIEPQQLERPMPEPDEIPDINSAKLLDIMHAVLMHWARWDNDHDPIIATLWAASTFFVDENGALMFNNHPRLFPIADMGSGKTRVMKLVRSMSRNPTGIVKAPVTAPGLRSALADHMTVFLDEIDRQVGRGMAHLDVQSLISAYERDTGSLNARGGTNEENVFGPMMLCAKTRIETGTGGYIDDLFERSFIIRLSRHDDPCDQIADLDNEFRSVSEAIPIVLTRWAEAIRWILRRNGDEIVEPIHSVPRRLRARQRELALPLLAVADRAVDPEVIGATGSDLRWATKAREAVQASLMGHGNDHDSNAMLDDAFKTIRKVSKRK